MRRAQQMLESLLHQPNPKPSRAIIQDELNFIRIRTEPEQRAAEISAALAGPAPDPNFAHDIQDLSWILTSKSRSRIHLHCWHGSLHGAAAPLEPPPTPHGNKATLSHGSSWLWSRPTHPTHSRPTSSTKPQRSLPAHPHTTPSFSTAFACSPPSSAPTKRAPCSTPPCPHCNARTQLQPQRASRRTHGRRSQLQRVPYLCTALHA